MMKGSKAETGKERQQRSYPEGKNSRIYNLREETRDESRNGKPVARIEEAGKAKEEHIHKQGARTERRKGNTGENGAKMALGRQERSLDGRL